MCCMVHFVKANGVPIHSLSQDESRGKMAMDRNLYTVNTARSLFLNVCNLLCTRLLEVKNNVLLMLVTPSAPNSYHMLCP